MENSVMDWWGDKSFAERKRLKKHYLNRMMVTASDIEYIFEKETSSTISDPALDSIKSVIKGTQMYQQFLLHNTGNSLLLDNLAVEVLRWHKNNSI